jgi:hypothetical protein
VTQNGPTDRCSTPQRKAYHVTKWFSLRPAQDLHERRKQGKRALPVATRYVRNVYRSGSSSLNTRAFIHRDTNHNRRHTRRPTAPVARHLCPTQTATVTVHSAPHFLNTMNNFNTLRFNCAAAHLHKPLHTSTLATNTVERIRELSSGQRAHAVQAVTNESSCMTER